MNVLEEALELLEKMVRIPSVEGQELEMGNLVEKFTSSLGMKVEKQEVEEGRYNVIAKIQIGKGGKTVILNSHMDVVPAAEGWETDPYRLTIKNGRAYGRGSTDAKGCLTALLIAVKSIIENPDGINGNIIVTAVVDEETYSKGTRYLISHTTLKADYGIIGEPTLCKIGIGHNGTIRPVLAIHGKTAHSSTPEKGISAVRIAAYISELVDEIQKELSKVVHPTTGKPSISITMLKVGVKENVLPDYGELVIDRRMIPGEKEENIIQTFEEICKKTEKAFPGAKVEIKEYLITTGPASEVSADSKIAQIAYRACEKVTGEKQTAFGLTCNTDMNHLVRAGIPCVIIGPGRIDMCHQPNEYVDLRQLETACKVDEEVIRELLKDG